MKSDFQYRLLLACILASLMVGNSSSFSHGMKSIILSVSLVIIIIVGIRVVYQKVKGTNK